MIYNKLVRDLIPDIIAADGKTAHTHIANEQEYQEALHKKLQEEVAEFLADPCIEELADINEVLYALQAHYEFDSQEVGVVQEKKKQERGGFSKRIILEKVED